MADEEDGLAGCENVSRTLLSLLLTSNNYPFRLIWTSMWQVEQPSGQEKVPGRRGLTSHSASTTTTHPASSTWSIIAAICRTISLHKARWRNLSTVWSVLGIIVNQHFSFFLLNQYDLNTTQKYTYNKLTQIPQVKAHWPFSFFFFMYKWSTCAHVRLYFYEPTVSYLGCLHPDANSFTGLLWMTTHQSVTYRYRESSFLWYLKNLVPEKSIGTGIGKKMVKKRIKKFVQG